MARFLGPFSSLRWVPPRPARLSRSLNHPHICTLHDVGSQDGSDFLVTEHLEGETLAQRLTKGALPLEQALQIAIQIADALDKAHPGDRPSSFWALRVSSYSCTNALWCYGRQPLAACQQIAEQASGNANKQSSEYVYRMVIPRVDAGDAEAYHNEAEPSCQLAMRWGQSDGEPDGARDVRTRKASA